VQPPEQIEKEPMRKARVGTVVEFLDEVKRDVMATFPFHKYTINRQEAMAFEFARVRWPGWLQLDVVFAKNGRIIPGREVQSEYWVTKQYTLFVQVVSWLKHDAWRSRDSILSVRGVVTVEPEGASVVGAIEPAPSSLWGEIITTPSEPTVSETVLYGVRRFSESDEEPLVMVPRHRLRHRKLHTKAYLGITDDKKHDSFAAQYFIKATLESLKSRFIDTGMEPFFAIHIHSDDASSHFKSAKTMYFVTTLLTFCASKPPSLPSPLCQLAHLPAYTTLNPCPHSGWVRGPLANAAGLLLRMI
jgi:hypothetical protein